MRIIQRLFEKNYIKKIRKEMEENDFLKYLGLNSIKNQAAIDLMNGRISENFYRKVFLGGNIVHHYTEVNKEYIENFR